LSHDTKPPPPDAAAGATTGAAAGSARTGFTGALGAGEVGVMPLTIASCFGLISSVRLL
jgi:hypothetical protein